MTNELANKLAGELRDSMYNTILVNDKWKAFDKAFMTSQNKLLQKIQKII